MKPNSVVFELTLKVTAAKLQRLIDMTATNWDKVSVKVENLTPVQLEMLKEELSVDSMLDEFIEGSYEAQANDWMCDFIDTLEDDEAKKAAWKRN